MNYIKSILSNFYIRKSYIKFPKYDSRSFSKYFLWDKKCKNCKGKGYIECINCKYYIKYNNIKCSDCNNKGIIECIFCSGDGKDYSLFN